ncbi:MULTISPECIES: SRPBCC family protein [Streptomyces]|uniref:SRPBCC family protein n=1 Tax=Streptomyces cacaoi TaxID=1898 RepID=A0A4Y3QU24_STRCI|nr:MULTISPECIES: SRPBCC family protein [Streptomyces]NNG88175.1 hypothetical protein [Streptomyces cacaoi]GEB48906.1 hypothetical protein SCA03_14570 [Streptomyces cacaoi]
MATTEVQTRIALPAQEVFALIAQPDRHPLWQKDLTSDGLVSGDGTAGSRGREVRRVMGRSVTTEYEITEHTDSTDGTDGTGPMVWGFRSLRGPIDMAGVFTCAPADDGCEVRARISFGGWSGQAMARFATRQFAGYLDDLKELAESGGHPAGDPAPRA